MLMACLLCFFIAVAVLFVFGGCAEKPTEKEYTISFTDVSGNELSAVTVKEGEIPVFEGDFPTLPAETNEKAYSWKWNKEIVAATENTTYQLVLVETDKYAVKFMNGNAEIGSTQYVVAGGKATAPADPTKDATAEFTYTFDGWYTAAEGGEKVTDFTVKGEATYYARFVSTTRKYKVKFMNGDEQIGETQTVAYGTAATAPANPTKDATAEFTYTFDGWYTAAEGGEKVTDFTVKGEATYYAQFTATKNRYTVTFISNGTTIQTESLEYGSPIVAPSDPIPETDYLFIGWEPVVAEVVTEDVSYTAKFAKILTQKDTANFKTILAENPNGDYVLGSDLDFEGANLADSTIIEFSGTFNGNGYALKNFVIEWYDPGDGGNWNSFVVSVNSGTIKNLAVYYKIVNINGGTAFIVDNVGTIDNCYFDVTFADAAERTAPIAEINRGTISHCVVNHHDGGLGEKATSVGLGGLVSSDYNGTFAHCYVAKNGISLDATHDMYKITWGNGSYSELHSYDSLNALANADFSAEGWNQELWEVKSGVLLFGEAIEKTQVLTQADAANFKTILAENPNGDYVLASDIDFEGKILVGAIKFAGTIDGRGFALKNFSLNFNDGSDNGYNAYLFESNAGKIMNLRIKMTIAASNNNKAALILTNTGILENIYVEFTLAQTYVQYTRVAPLVYDNVGTGRIRNCIVKVSLAEGVTIFDAENKNDFAAAVAVYNKDGGTMEHCYAVGDTNIPAVLYGWATQSHIASFASLAECSANVDFAPTNGWNSDYKEIIFSEVIAAKTLD